MSRTNQLVRMAVITLLEEHEELHISMLLYRTAGGLGLTRGQMVKLLDDLEDEGIITRRVVSSSRGPHMRVALAREAQP